MLSLDILIIAILATWRISSMLYYEVGPFDVFFKLREAAGVYPTDENGYLLPPTTFFGKLLHCFWCITFWIAVIIWSIAVYAPWLLVPFALSGGALLLSQSGRLIWRKMAED